MTEHRYVLGSAEAELRRLDLQAASIDRPTRLLLRATGIGEGMRVLDLGTGLGHVSAILAELVGPEGEVVGLDQSAEVLEVAAGSRGRCRTGQRPLRAGRRHRLARRPAVRRRRRPAGAVPHARPGRGCSATTRARSGPAARMAMIDFDVGAARTEPPTDAAMQTQGVGDGRVPPRGHAPHGRHAAGAPARSRGRRRAWRRSACRATWRPTIRPGRRCSQGSPAPSAR